MTFSLFPLLPSSTLRITSLCQHDDKLYVGCANGTIRTYTLDAVTSDGEAGPSVPRLQLLTTHQLSKRSIDQLGVLPYGQQLAVLSESVITLYSLPNLEKGSSSVLAQARSAHCFSITSYASINKTKSLKSVRSEDVGKEDKSVGDVLIVGCRKKVVVYGFGRGYKEGWELALPHSPRQIVIPFSNPSFPPGTVHLLYSPQNSVLLHINISSTPHLTTTDLTTSPVPPATTSADSTQTGSTYLSTGEGTGLGLGGMSSLTGLGGYVGLGSKAAIPLGTRTAEGEALLARDELGVFYSSEGNYTRGESLRFPSMPDLLEFSNPYIYSVVTSPTTAGPPSTALQVHLGPTLSLRHTVPIPAPTTGSMSVSSSTLITPTGRSPAESLASGTKLCFVSTPTDKTLAQSEGSSVWALQAGDLGEDVDDLVREGKIGDAIGLVDAVGEDNMTPSRRLPHLKTLQAVQQFAKGDFQTAMDTFLIFDVNPALVVSLFPAETISGRSHVSREAWMELFGAVSGARLDPESSASDNPTKGLLKSMTHLSIGKKNSFDSIKAADNLTATSAEPAKVDDTTTPRAALEALMYYLSDRRQKLTGAINLLTSPLPPESSLPPLSSLSADELHALPSIPMPEMEPEQLLRVAQVIYTALLKVYLVARPILVGSLCRIENWCDVVEVEELLKQQKKFGDLIDLYQGKKMHSKALTLLHELAKEEEDRLDRYPPTVRYLHKLGSEGLDLIFEHSKWVINENTYEGLQIFIAEEPEVESLPRKQVVEFLETTSKEACIGYLEHLIHTLQEQGAEYHDKLAELYLERVKSSKDDEIKEKLLDFLIGSNQYRAYRLLNRLGSDEMPEARAILLGRMGRHEDALKIYLYDLNDYSAADLYCSRVYSKFPDPSGIYLTLLHLYLRPSPPNPILISPALTLIAKHGTRLEPQAVLDLLPPLLTMQQISEFLIKTLRGGHAAKEEHRVVKQLVGARKEEVERNLMNLQVRHVRINDQRICPQCHKRLGASAIAIHSPRGEVTHLHCKDLFNSRLAKLRD
ncbi:hypothetical protein TREMEDRAFT_70067 [Tremella mesenterica DSM 1558]|uniref:uncharacterized protein n=1 Tax=Tremella mesenterica (strain ATCC 24925 / CBS 8224 / DSM 1558 / NBRC 9311 / NRRL Y-6157 / RJB 2259-6 / UBC 559-6) TaxID=578456 RepID=UPI00032BB5DF|nr:uncharacterized protein TREMEDRAFT_70067 [Tremella mesenterica DSM 1558]EIW66424.1 hypothetical protein TREMEDRAFT_70067 [Tremella mesenterica DSM 1558]